MSHCASSLLAGDYLGADPNCGHDSALGEALPRLPLQALPLKVAGRAAMGGKGTLNSGVQREAIAKLLRSTFEASEALFHALSHCKEAISTDEPVGADEGERA